MTGKAPEAQLSKVSDAAIRERTGRGWDEWFALLDARGATGASSLRECEQDRRRPGGPPLRGVHRRVAPGALAVR